MSLSLNSFVDNVAFRDQCSCPWRCSTAHGYCAHFVTKCVAVC